ncbi:MULTISPECIES: HlyD family efflux transporter periplasmic adaptor subunit [Leptolyngbya]|jgi:hypothetical protein|uniref:HlyD family efflux transporter periplasmic adaptor subunit n=1 Tax=Leptolyngbya TaxID=47251 RepID=UPI000365F735|nr:MULTISPECIES: HlyD family efflux transporter periplasmic adaptor subunit [Leptolyngbya]MBD2371119.1 HlyD family efflux transporter periplasmic adaptor subunit [Leptolyngbya sp. FACHB-161]MBD2377587.1 HlyD family efflux transporter periplasmic adaptor subunit [Leptolyngbya sp. FACHB-238]MBD2402040.1 HlyD family efflux transporter periplasmic adaptor subunit [Leptolyngbya sp. FACHB-239]MBD2408559.1 HlyD family efflux transporter periplasmic adaptor subunit [Leptolyngbya sp. FACHB-402]BAS60463
MVKQASQTTASVSEQDIATLDTFAQKALQTNQLSEVMMVEPSLMQRGAIYFMTAALGAILCLLYLGRVPVWVSARGKIVPTKTTPLVVKATVPNKDIGFIKVGMLARIKVDAYPFQQFGSISAQVQQITPDSSNEDNFTVTLGLLQNSIKTNEHSIQLFSGLTVQAEVQTRNQRLFDVLLSK